VRVTNTATNPVQVAITNPTVTPLPVTDVDNAARQPFQKQLNWKNDPTQLGGGTSFIVPAGKRLVIEQISAFTGLAQGTAMAFSVHTTVNGTPAPHRFALNLSPVGGGDYAHYWFVDRLVRIYADGDTAVSVDIQNTLGGEAATWSTISGYLENLK
jgi:hypothetical protein